VRKTRPAAGKTLYLGRKLFSSPAEPNIFYKIAQAISLKYIIRSLLNEKGSNYMHEKT
jgi:hypothetical protein